MSRGGAVECARVDEEQLKCAQTSEIAVRETLYSRRPLVLGKIRFLISFTSDFRYTVSIKRVRCRSKPDAVPSVHHSNNPTVAISDYRCQIVDVNLPWRLLVTACLERRCI